MNRKTLLLSAFTAGTFAAAALTAATFAVEPAAATPATQPTTRPALPEPVAAPDDLTGTRLAIRAQQAFNRGEYITALPLLQKLAAEAEGQPAKKASIQERIRVCEKAIAAAKAEGVAKNLNTATAGEATGVDVTAEARKPHPAPVEGQVYEVAIQGLGNFEYDQDRGGNVPDDVQKLSGAKIRVRGYMIPMDSAENITQFALVPSLFACCYGQPPSIQHTIVVNCPKGKAVGYTGDEIVVEGGLKVQERKDDGYILSLFEMEVSSVKIAPKG